MISELQCAPGLLQACIVLQVCVSDEHTHTKHNSDFIKHTSHNDALVMPSFIPFTADHVLLCLQGDLVMQ